MSKLARMQDIAGEYQTVQREYQRTKDDAEICTDYEKRRADDRFHSVTSLLGKQIDWFTDLLAIAEAAVALRETSLFFTEGLPGYGDEFLICRECSGEEHSLDCIVGKFEKALAKVEGD